MLNHGELDGLNQSGWFALLQRPYFRDAVQLRQLLVRQESPLSPLIKRNAVNRPRAAMRRRPETAEGARIKFWIAKAMLEDCWQIYCPGPVTWYAMSYRCGPSDGRLANFPFRGQRFKPP